MIVKIGLCVCVCVCVVYLCILLISVHQANRIFWAFQNLSNVYMYSLGVSQSLPPLSHLPPSHVSIAFVLFACMHAYLRLRAVISFSKRAELHLMEKFTSMRNICNGEYISLFVPSPPLKLTRGQLTSLYNKRIQFENNVHTFQIPGNMFQQF